MVQRPCGISRTCTCSVHNRQDQERGGHPTIRGRLEGLREIEAQEGKRDMPTVKLNCPDCGAALELPDNLGVAHCLYCGTRIQIERTEAAREQQDLKRYLELCRIAVEARNHNETIQYCNKILEINPSDVETWIHKATATFWLTTVADNRYDEAMEYLKKAAEIAPADGRISRAKAQLTLVQARWYNDLGVSAFKISDDLWKSYKSGMILTRPAARQCVDELKKAIDYYLLAARYAPEDMTILGNLEQAATTGLGGRNNWGPVVQTRLESLGHLRAKKQAEANLLELRAQLQEAEAGLGRLDTKDLQGSKNRKGLFSGSRLKSTEGRMTKLRTQIAQNETVAAYRPPQV